MNNYAPRASRGARLLAAPEFFARKPLYIMLRLAVAGALLSGTSMAAAQSDSQESAI